MAADLFEGEAEEGEEKLDTALPKRLGSARTSASTKSSHSEALASGCKEAR